MHIDQRSNKPRSRDVRVTGWEAERPRGWVVVYPGTRPGRLLLFFEVNRNQPRLHAAVAAYGQVGEAVRVPAASVHPVSIDASQDLEHRLVRPATDRPEPGIPEVAGRPRLLHVPDAAVELEAPVCDLACEAT